MSGPDTNQPVKEEVERENPLSLSDEDFLNQNEPAQEEIQENPDPEPSEPETKGDPEPVKDSKKDPEEPEEVQESGQPTEESDSSDSKPEKEGDAPQEPKEKTPVELAAERAAEQAEEKKAKSASKSDKKPDETAEASKDPSGSKESAEKKPDSEVKAKKETAPESGSETNAEGESEGDADYKAFHDQIMAPFNANGKKIQVKTPAEAISLMQMGANYTRKLQELAPHRKILTMLGNHNLLDESKLSLFIALDKGDPEAVKKLIVDKGIDPLDIDTKTESTYQDDSYKVTDSEVAFRTQLDELSSTDEGKLTLVDISENWDQISKDMLWQHPQVMSIIHEQRENGIYTKITEEMDRRRTLGQMPVNTPFLEAYKVIGDELHEQGAFGEITKQLEADADGKPIKPEQEEEPAQKSDSGPKVSAEKPANGAVVATRAASPRPSVDNGDKVGAAAPTRSTPSKAKEVTNFLSMNDDDFLRAADLQGRV